MTSWAEGPTAKMLAVQVTRDKVPEVPGLGSPSMPVLVPGAGQQGAGLNTQIKDE